MQVSSKHCPINLLPLQERNRNRDAYLTFRLAVRFLRFYLNNSLIVFFSATLCMKSINFNLSLSIVFYHEKAFISNKIISSVFFFKSILHLYQWTSIYLLPIKKLLIQWSSSNNWFKNSKMIKMIRKYKIMVLKMFVFKST